MSDVRRATVRERRQVTLPADICRELGITPGDNVVIEVQEGALRITPSKKKAIDAMEAIERALAEAGISEEELLREGRRIRKEVTRELYGDLSRP